MTVLLRAKRCRSLLRYRCDPLWGAVPVARRCSGLT
jgi:hypothetical protein